MRYDVTRDVVSDLYPLYQSGEASRDSKALVDAYLASDSEFATLLEAGDQVRRVVPQVRLSPEAELRVLQEAQRTARTRLLIIGGTVALGGTLALLSLLAVLFVFLRAGR
jgi:hypothetical protein